MHFIQVALERANTIFEEMNLLGIFVEGLGRAT